MIDTATERMDGQHAPRALAGPAAPPAAPAASAATGRATRRLRLTYDQFLLGQIPLIVTLALVFSFIAYAARSQMPVGGAATGAGGAAAGAAAVSGAGGDAPITAFADGTATQQVLVAADPTGALKWDRAVYEAQAGDVTFVVSNKSSSPHNFAVEGPNVKAQGPNFGANTTTTYTLRGLKPGEYQIICNYPGHRAAGMVAKLIVR
jgi:plastocyanin